MTRTLKEQVAAFFAPPTDSGAGKLQLSTLYLLRREIQDCFIGEVVAEDEVLSPDRKRHRLFASAMLIFSGVDLLAKFAAGSDKKGQGRQRFTAFLTRFCETRNLMGGVEPISNVEADVLFNFRNALVHSFGMHHEDDLGNRVPMVMFQADGPAPVVARRPSGTWDLSVDDLFEMFVKSIDVYLMKLKRDRDLQSDFASMFDKYGTLYVNILNPEE